MNVRIGKAPYVFALLLFWGCASSNTVDTRTNTGSALDICTVCHGSETSIAPPRDVNGNTSETARGVGAHQSHLNTSALSAPVPCQACHTVPENPADPGHMDSPLPAEVTFGDQAKLDGAEPVWNGETCSGTYCHGATLGGGSNPAPNWTQVDGSQAACGSCHGLPPPPPHPTNAGCEQCHAPVAGPGLTIAEASMHVNGQIEVDSKMACSACHGSSQNAAPPLDLSGRSSTSLVTVGAHQSHLTGLRFSNSIACSECHDVPTDVNSNGHIGTDSISEVKFGSLATSDGLSPSWNRTTARCSNVYCHGASLGNGSNPSPVWTTVNGSQVACGTCHAIPPAAPHPNNSDCNLCHLGEVGPGPTITKKEAHINGTIDLDPNLPCNACHGSSQNPAPPVDLQGRNSTSLVTVGAHQSHLTATSSFDAVPCSECHVVPSEMNSPGHIGQDSVAEVMFGSLARTGGVSPTWNRATARCSNTYCHGNFSGGTRTNSPLWTGTGQADCGTCHNIPPSTGRHQKNQHIAAGCAVCHGTSSALTHLNGAKDVGGSGYIQSWDGFTCWPTCHESETW